MGPDDGRSARGQPHAERGRARTMADGHAGCRDPGDGLHRLVSHLRHVVHRPHHAAERMGAERHLELVHPRHLPGASCALGRRGPRSIARHLPVHQQLPAAEQGSGRKDGAERRLVHDRHGRHRGTALPRRGVHLSLVRLALHGKMIKGVISIYSAYHFRRTHRGTPFP